MKANVRFIGGRWDGERVAVSCPPPRWIDVQSSAGPIHWYRFRAHKMGTLYVHRSRYNGMPVHRTKAGASTPIGSGE